MGRYGHIARLALLAAAVAGVEIFYGWGELFSRFDSFAKGFSDSPVLFWLLMSIGCAFAFPLSICYLFAGAAFGFGAGWLLSLGVLAVSSALGYWLGVFFVPKSFPERVAAKFGISTDFSERAMFNVNFAVRVIPGIPYWVQNVFLGAIRSKFPLYMFVNIAAQGAIAGAMNFVGSSLSDGGYGKYAAFAVLVAVLAAFHICANLRYKKIRAETEAVRKQTRAGRLS